MRKHRRHNCDLDRSRCSQACGAHRQLQYSSNTSLSRKHGQSHQATRASCHRPCTGLSVSQCLAAKIHLQEKVNGSFSKLRILEDICSKTLTSRPILRNSSVFLWYVPCLCNICNADAIIGGTYLQIGSLLPRSPPLSNQDVFCSALPAMSVRLLQILRQENIFVREPRKYGR